MQINRGREFKSLQKISSLCSMVVVASVLYDLYLVFNENNPLFHSFLPVTLKQNDLINLFGSCILVITFFLTAGLLLRRRQKPSKLFWVNMFVVCLVFLQVPFFVNYIVANTTLNTKINNSTWKDGVTKFTGGEIYYRLPNYFDEGMNSNPCAPVQKFGCQVHTYVLFSMRVYNYSFGNGDWPEEQIEQNKYGIKYESEQIDGYEVVHDPLYTMNAIRHFPNYDNITVINFELSADPDSIDLFSLRSQRIVEYQKAASAIIHSLHFSRHLPSSDALENVNLLQQPLNNIYYSENSTGRIYAETKAYFMLPDFIRSDGSIGGFEGEDPKSKTHLHMAVDFREDNPVSGSVVDSLTTYYKDSSDIRFRTRQGQQVIKFKNSSKYTLSYLIQTPTDPHTYLFVQLSEDFWLFEGFADNMIKNMTFAPIQSCNPYCL